MSTINGIGFGYLGQAEPKKDGSYIRTKWFFLVFPLIPAGSYRIWPESNTSYLGGMYSSSTFRASPVPLHWPHIFKIYGTYLAFVIFIKVFEKIGGTMTMVAPLAAAGLAYGLYKLLKD